MSSSLLITLEMAGVLGVVLILGFYELWSLRRDKTRDAKRAAEAEINADAATGQPAEK